MLGLSEAVLAKNEIAGTRRSKLLFKSWPKKDLKTFFR